TVVRLSPCSILPPLPPLVTIESKVNPGPGGLVISYFDFTLGGGTILDGLYDAWCVDTAHGIGSGSFDAVPVCSFESPANQVVDHPENFDLVNWLSDQVLKGNVIGQASVCGGAYTYGDVQRAIWQLLENTL